MKNFLSVLLWIPALAIRLLLIAIGLVLVPFSLAGDGVKRTPPMWSFWADAENLARWWDADELPAWSYGYIPVVAGLAWYSYGHWYAPVTIWLIFCFLGTAIAASSKERWIQFWWWAIRNPTKGFAEKFTQPIKEPRPNPDNLVYSGEQKSAWRFLRHGWQSEFWYLRAVGGKGKKFEFRIGWKFADGTPGFAPTISIRRGD